MAVVFRRFTFELYEPDVSDVRLSASAEDGFEGCQGEGNVL